MATQRTGDADVYTQVQRKKKKPRNESNGTQSISSTMQRWTADDGCWRCNDNDDNEDDEVQTLAMKYDASKDLGISDKEVQE